MDNNVIQTLLSANMNMVKALGNLQKEQQQLTVTLKQLVDDMKSQQNQMNELSSSVNVLNSNIREIIEDTSAEEFVDSILQENRRRDASLQSAMERLQPHDYTSVLEQMTNTYATMNTIIDTTLTQQNTLLTQVSSRLQAVELLVGAAVNTEGDPNDMSTVLAELAKFSGEKE